MKNAKEMLQELKNAKFSSILQSVTKNLSESDLMTYVKTLPMVESFERKELVKFILENSDKTLTGRKYSEGEPVKAADESAPDEAKNGKVKPIGKAESHFDVNVQDGSVDKLTPEQIMKDNKAESDGIVTEEEEQKESLESKGEVIFSQTGKGGQTITIEKEGEYFAMLRTVDGKIIDKQMFNSAQAAEHAILPYL